MDCCNGVGRRNFLLLVVGSLLGFVVPRRAYGFTIISEADENEIGKRADQEILGHFGRYRDQQLQAYVESIGQRLLDGIGPTSFRYSFKIIDVPEVNAMALPGGYIYITRGMLAMLNSEAQLAGVLGHEIGHVTSRHAAKQLTKAFGAQILSLGLMAASPGGRQNTGEWAKVSGAIFEHVLLGYGREAELEADELGLRTAQRAGYDPEEMVAFLKAMKVKERLEALGYHGFQGTHPETIDRVVKAETMASILIEQSGGSIEVKANEYKAHLDGLVYGAKRDNRHLRIYVAKDGDTPTTVARDVLGDQQLAWEVANLNGIKEAMPFHEGDQVKLLPPVSKGSQGERQLKLSPN
ncbi:MAG: M48 family metalloprotease [bacterium]|uniref:M48 family metalloprotease n=1 Tax=Candidatus Methylomirabilis tolerans TaxID=3123416 RepID=A0AAJ1AKT3_9BACT|nr:M48 family metalloprotease [Candidatus Methylomirabilis sp.]